MHLLSSKFPMFLDVASFYSHILTSVFNYIFQVVKQQGIDSTEDQDDYGMDDYDDIFNSPSVEESFQQATFIATLAEKFGMTSFKPFQKNVISATLDRRDTLVIHPTGSGKSLCFQFPPVYQNKKAIVVTPTISLMQDQVHALNSKGIPCVLVGSAQVDKQACARTRQ